MENQEIKRDDLKEQIVTNIASYNEALQKGELKKVNELDVALKQLEVDYATLVAHELYRECIAQENPILHAMQNYQYYVIGHRDNKEDGIVTERLIIEDKIKQIDIAKMVKYCNDRKKTFEKELPTDWINYIEKFNQLMAMRVAKELGFTDEQVKKLATTYYMSEVARKLDMGKTPLSNNQMCKLLQTCIDKMLYIDNNGKNKYVVTNFDCAYIQNLYVKRGKEVLNVQVARHDLMRGIVSNVLFRLVNDKKYGIEYKAIKE